MQKSRPMVLATVIFGCIICLTSAATVPPSRWGTSCAIVSTSIYCYGGDSRTSGVDTILSDTWALSVANNFDVSNPVWSNITWANFPATPRAFGTINSLSDGSSFVINGGLTTPIGTAEANQTIVFNTVTKEWKPINTTLVQTLDHQAVIDANGKIWYFGGVSDSDTGRNNISYWEGLAVLNSITWQLTTTRVTTGGYVNARIGHSMTILPNGVIQIIGGYVATLLPGLDPRGYLQWRFDLAPMGTVAVYDTVKAAWSTKSVTGSIPPSRNFHTATLARDGSTIIIFGGSGSMNGSSLYNDLYSLNTNKMYWTHIDIGGAPSPRYGHSSVQVNETMFILFGLDSTNTSLSDINALDTVNWQWVQQFSVSGYKQQSNNSYPAAINGSSSSTDGSSGSGLGSGAIAGIAVGAVVVVAAIGAATILIRRRNRKHNRYTDDLQTELVENRPKDNNAGLQAPPQREWYKASFDGTDGSGSIPPGYHSHIGSYNTKPNAIDDSAANAQFKPDEQD